MEWFYANESDQQVSFQEENFQGLVEAGSIKEGTLVWNETMSDWKPCSDVRPDLFGVAASSPPDNSIPADTAQPAAAQPTAVPSLSATPAQNDPLAITSLVCGILSFTCMPLLGIVAIICGHMARKKLVEQTGSTEGGGLSLAGLIMGYIGLATGLVVLIFYILFVGIAIANEGM